MCAAIHVILRSSLEIPCFHFYLILIAIIGKRDRLNLDTNNQQRVGSKLRQVNRNGIFKKIIPKESTHAPLYNVFNPKTRYFYVLVIVHSVFKFNEFKQISKLFISIHCFIRKLKEGAINTFFWFDYQSKPWNDPLTSRGDRSKYCILILLTQLKSNTLSRF